MGLWTAATAGVLLTSLFLRLLFFNGPVASDDTAYFEVAEQLLRTGHLSEINHWASRLVFLVLGGLPGVLAGSMFLSAFTCLLFASLTDLVVTLVVRREFGALPGFVAASYTGFAGVTLVHAGTFLPEPLLSLLMVLSAIAVYYAVPADSLPAMFLAGVLTGLAYSVKDTGILLIPPVILYLGLTSGRPLRARLALACLYGFGFAAIWLSESFVYLMATDEFFYKIQAVNETHNANIGPAGSAGEFLRGAGRNAGRILTNQGQLLVPLAIAGPAWLITLLYSPRLRLFAASGLFVCLYLVAGTSSLERLINLPFQARYFQPMLPFAAICLGYVAAGLERRRLAAWSAVVGAVVLFAIGVNTAVPRAGAIYRREALRTAAIAIESLPVDAEPVFVDSRMHRALRHVLAPKELDRVHLAPEDSEPHGYYLLYRRHRDADAATRQSAAGGTPVVTLAIDQRIARRYLRLGSSPEFIIHVVRR